MGSQRVGYDWVTFNLQFWKPLSPPHLVAQTVENLPSMHNTWVWSLGREDPLENKMSAHFLLSWRIPWTEEPASYSPWSCKELDRTERLTQFVYDVRKCFSLILCMQLSRFSSITYGGDCLFSIVYSWECFHLPLCRSPNSMKMEVPLFGTSSYISS